MGFFKDFGAELCGVKCQNGVYEADLTNILSSGLKTWIDVLLTRKLFKSKNLVQVSKEVSSSFEQVKQGAKDTISAFKTPKTKITDDRQPEPNEVQDAIVVSAVDGGVEDV
jgi:hypothetical protein